MSRRGSFTRFIIFGALKFEQFIKFSSLKEFCYWVPDFKDPVGRETLRRFTWKFNCNEVVPKGVFGGNVHNNPVPRKIAPNLNNFPKAYIIHSDIQSPFLVVRLLGR